MGICHTIGVTEGQPEAPDEIDNVRWLVIVRSSIPVTASSFVVEVGGDHGDGVAPSKD